MVGCCRWNFTAADGLSQPATPNDLDWVRFVQLARYHRVQGLVWNALAQEAAAVPDYARGALTADARQIAATNLGIAKECAELREDFERSAIPLLFVKGLTVGALAYCSPMLKMGWDIDLLIDPADLRVAADLLTRRGYSLRLPSTQRQLHSWHARSKESVWIRGDCLHVELHTRLADNRHMIPGLGVHSPGQLVKVDFNLTLPTLAEDELFAYLAVHGASSAWFRLKWISDFAALVHGRDPEDIARLYSRSQEFGAGRAAGQALLLADALFDLLAGAPALRDNLRSERATRLLCHAALRMLTKGSREPTEQRLGTLTIHWTQFLLQRGAGYMLSELRRQLGSMLHSDSG
ncbi:MAG: nucleotidyltransferase family protein [Sphingomicrobium sp.]